MNEFVSQLTSVIKYARDHAMVETLAKASSSDPVARLALYDYLMETDHPLSLVAESAANRKPRADWERHFNRWGAGGFEGPLHPDGLRTAYGLFVTPVRRRHKSSFYVNSYISTPGRLAPNIHEYIEAELTPEELHQTMIKMRDDGSSGYDLDFHNARFG